jgi:hypothetical protein
MIRWGWSVFFVLNLSIASSCSKRLVPVLPTSSNVYMIHSSAGRLSEVLRGICPEYQVHV